MVEKKLGGAGLRGQSAGETSLCTVGKEGSGLTYRGYTIEDLAQNAGFEEIAYMLLYGALPSVSELEAYKQRLISFRELPDSLKAALRLIPKEAHPMDVMRTGCSVLGNLEPELSFDDQQDAADRLLATLPGMITYWYRYSHDSIEISTDTGQDSTAGHFLKMLSGKDPSDMHRSVMDCSLILYAEHEFNASTFTARVCAATLSDMYSCITGAFSMPPRNKLSSTDIPQERKVLTTLSWAGEDLAVTKAVLIGFVSPINSLFNWFSDSTNDLKGPPRRGTLAKFFSVLRKSSKPFF